MVGIQSLPGTDDFKVGNTTVVVIGRGGVGVLLGPKLPLRFAEQMTGQQDAAAKH